MLPWSVRPKSARRFSEEACAGNESLRKQVEALLAAHEEAGSFIENPAMQVEARGVAADQGVTGAELRAGESISHYCDGLRATTRAIRRC
jgi:hypothetical protein